MEQIKETALRLQPYVDAMTALCIGGRYADYHIQNPSRSYSKRSNIRKTLKLWEIENETNLKDALAWLTSHGLRKEFAELSGMLSVLSVENRARHIEETDDPIQKHKLSVIAQYLGRLPAGGIAAYDYSWAVFICCAAHKINYMTEQDKWDHIDRFVGLAKESYSEWNDYMAGFAIGAVYSFGHKRSGYVADNQRVFAKLMFSCLSPFRKVRLS